MPTVSDILSQVQVQFPNTFTNAQLLTWGNEIGRKIWKWMDDTEVYTFDIIANLPTYTLPSNGLSLDKVTVIEIATSTAKDTWEEYYFKGLLDETEQSNYFFDATNGIFGLYPVPTTSITGGGVIYYGAKFTLMSDSSLGVTPSVNEDYHSLIVNYICMKAAGSGNNPDVDMRNAFAIDFNDDWKRLMFDWTNKKCKLQTKNRVNKWWR